MTQMPLVLVLWAQATGADTAVAIYWEIMKGLLLFTITGCSAVLAKAALTMRDDVRDMKGKLPNIEQALELVVEDVELLKVWRVRQVAIEESQRDEYQGEERRRSVRRALDMLRDQIVEEVKKEGL